MDTFWKYLLANFDCSRVAYLHMDMNNNGLLETNELKEFFDIKFPNLRTNERVIKNVLKMFDPEHTGKITAELVDLFKVFYQLLVIPLNFHLSVVCRCFSFLKQNS